MKDAEREDAARDFVLGFLLFSGLAMAAIVALVILVDPGGELGTGVLRPLTWTARQEKIRLLRTHSAPRPRLLVLGSSRAMKVSPRFLHQQTGLVSFNASVNSARTEDLLCLLRYSVEDLGLDIRTVVLGLDLQMFHGAAPVDPRLLAIPQLSAKLGAPPGTLDRLRRIGGAVNFETVKLSARSVYFRLAGYPERHSTYDSSGFLTYVRWERELAGGTYDLESKIQNSIQDYRARYADFRELSASRIGYFRTLLEYCRDRDIELLVFLTGFHPRTLAYLVEQTHFPALMTRLKEVLAELRSVHPFALVDGTDPLGYGGDATSFYDGAHVREENQRKLTRTLLGKRATGALQ